MRISDKQNEMLAFIEDFMEENGYPPTLEEIRVGLGISSKSLVNYHLDVLEKAGHLSRSPNTSRGIRLANENERVRVPLLDGGQGSASVEPGIDSTEVIELTGDIVPNRRNLYAFKVEGDSMLDAFVNKGDIVVMQRQKKAKNGEMVAVRLGQQNKTLLKHFYRENGHVRLQPANPNTATMIVEPDAVEIQGKVVAVIRQVS